MNNEITKSMITALILAGGMGRRMGGHDKGMVEFNGRYLVEHIIDALQPQVATILINANRNHDTYARYGYPVIADQLEGYQGPLAGFATGLHHADTPYLLTVPCDGPWLSEQLADRLTDALLSKSVKLAVAHDGERLQPVYSLIHISLLPSLERFLETGERKIDKWFAQHPMATADFSDNPTIFNNINTQQDFARMQQEMTS